MVYFFPIEGSNMYIKVFKLFFFRINPRPYLPWDKSQCHCLFGGVCHIKMYYWEPWTKNGKSSMGSEVHVYRQLLKAGLAVHASREFFYGEFISYE